MKARATSSTVHDHGTRSSSVRSSGAAAPGARTSHAFHTAPSGPSSASKRRPDQSGTGQRSASQANSPTRRAVTDSGAPSTDR